MENGRVIIKIPARVQKKCCGLLAKQEAEMSGSRKGYELGSWRCRNTQNSILVTAEVEGGLWGKKIQGLWLKSAEKRTSKSKPKQRRLAIALQL